MFFYSEMTFFYLFHAFIYFNALFPQIKLMGQGLVFSAFEKISKQN